MAVKIYRINFKSDFVLTVQCDAGWNLPFCVKFWTGAPSQSYFAGFNGTEYRNCRMGDTPDKIVVLFDDHHLPIGELKMQIAYHTTIEEFPTVEYDEVTNAQAVTTILDGEEYHVMLDFTGETAPEIQFSLPAYYNEQERQRVFAEMQAENAQSVQEAENVNVQLDGTILTVTNRNGISTSSNVQGPEGPQGPPGIGGEQSDWNETDPTAGSYIKNKPDIYTQQQTDQLLAGKQNVITDLATIRSNAEDGKQALTDVTAVEQLIPAAATPLNKLTDKEYVDTSLAGKQNVISDLATIRSNAEDGKQALTDVTAVEQLIPAAATPSNKLTDKEYVDTSLAGKQNVISDLATIRSNAEDGKQALTDVTAVEQLIPSTASAQNKLADQNFVNSSVATNTANYISNNGEPFTSLAQLEAYSGTLTNNDYAFVVGTDAAGNTTYTRYKYNADTQQWAAEYVLNNSSFTAEQWAAIQSGITSALVGKLSDLPTNAELTVLLGAKANTSSLAAVAFSGSYNDLSDKPTTMVASGSGHKGGFVPDTPSTGGVTKFLREDATWDVPATPVETVSGTTVTQQLAPNKFYSFGEVTSLTVTLGSIISCVSNEYAFEFDSGSTATTLSIPSSVVGIDATSIKANKHYEISIKYDASNQNYYGIIQEW